VKEGGGRKAGLKRQEGRGNAFFREGGENTMRRLLVSEDGEAFDVLSKCDKKASS